MRLTQDQELSSTLLLMGHTRTWLPRGLRGMEETHSRRNACHDAPITDRVPMPPVHDVQDHLHDHQHMWRRNG